MKELFDLRNGQEDKEITLENVKSNISFRGANLWILVCAILIASIGLNINSTAIIIGAMLISPLMGPIIGAGFALGTYNFDLLKRSFKNLGIATLVGICVSGLYFYLSPFKEVQSELLARTSPNIFDILIAVFGGVVGVIAMTRIQKGNPLPGVAIATALMPPLCTAGYALASGNIIFFLGASYLYLINIVFICLATFTIVKYLKYPLTQHLDIIQQKRIRIYITSITLILIIPSIWFAYSLYQKQDFITKADRFLTEEFINKGEVLFYKKNSYFPGNSTIEIAVLGKQYNDNTTQSLEDVLHQYYGLTNTHLIIRQETSDSTATLKNDILNEVNTSKKNLDDKEVLITNLQGMITKSNINTLTLLSEIRVLYTKINHINFATIDIKDPDSLLIGIYESSENLDTSEIITLIDWLKIRLNRKNIELYNRAIPLIQTGSLTGVENTGTLSIEGSQSGKIAPELSILSTIEK